MAHTFLRAEKIISQGLGLLERELVLPRLAVRYGLSDFKGNKNDTVTIRIPAILRARDYEWRTRNSPIEVDDLTEYSVSVRLDRHIYSAVNITDEQLTLDIDSWGTQVARPQIRAVAEQLEGTLATAMETTANYRHTVRWTPGRGDSDDFSFQRTANAARKYLNAENVPAAGRVMLLGSNVEEAALNSPNLIRVNEAGFSGTLREAVIGRIAGFTVIGNVNSIDPDFAVAMHPTAFALGNVAPAVPDGVTKGATDTYESLAMRWIKDYEAAYLRDRSVYSAFAGASSVEDGRDLDPESNRWGELTRENVRAVEIAFTAGS